MSLLVKNIFRFVLLMLLQVFVLDQIRLHQLVTPYLYFIFILWMPFRIGRARLMVLAFLLGLTLDGFRHHPGFHTAACVLMAYLRPFIINLLMTKEAAESNFEEPSFRAMGGIFQYFIYLFTMIFVHNIWLFLLEAWQFSNVWYFLSKSALSTLISLLLVMITELIFVRNQKFKTNTA